MNKFRFKSPLFKRSEYVAVRPGISLFRQGPGHSNKVVEGPRLENRVTGNEPLNGQGLSHPVSIPRAQSLAFGDHSINNQEKHLPHGTFILVLLTVNTPSVGYLLFLP